MWFILEISTTGCSRRFLTATQTSAPGPAHPNLFFRIIGPGANVVNVPTGGTLSITNGDYCGVHSTPYQMQWNFNIGSAEIVTNTVRDGGLYWHA